MDKITSKQLLSTVFTIPNTLKLIFRLEKKYATYLIVINVLIALFPLGIFYVYQELINAILLQSNKVLQTLVIYFIVQSVSSIFVQINAFFLEKFNLNLSYSLSKKLITKTSSLELADFENADTYNLVENLTQDSTYKPYQLFNAIISFFSSIISLLVCLFYISTWKTSIALFLLCIPLISLVTFLKIGQLEFLIQWNRVGAERKVWYYIYLLTHDFSFKEIKLNNISDYLINKFSLIKEEFISQDSEISKKKNIFNAILDILLNFINCLVIIMLISAVRAGEILLGNLISLIQALTRINTYSQSMIQSVYIIYNTSLFMEQLFNFFESEQYDQSNIYINNTDISLKEVSEINLVDVSYCYPNSSINALSEISLSFKCGELVAIVGKNGSGKSTLVKLLCGLYKPSQGEIVFNGISNKNLDLAFYQKHVSVLFQDFVKYELTLRENIALSNLEILNDTQAIKLALKKFSFEVDRDIDMQLGTWFQDGRQLSGGQWQKLALVRTFLKNASVYILDEPSSALDPVSEKEIFDKFIELSRDHVSIFISHNLKSAKKADKIIVMKDGKVDGVGNHETLLRTNEHYKKMYYSEQYEEL
ncbi:MULTISPECIES: ABC transporter ATP-binding protein [Streptococcus]|nr:MULTISPECIES: ABC transporter ATP-binding protein [Streptococcus]MCO8237826.1 ABC transporter ATP-binding protein/permease [Streptococcus suis]MDG3291976.1 ABC transporter ATP-binding protein/permease [Streptococcus suis]MDW8658929.1 ABC transporter ATP-binding protein [Streptococcus suis]MDW8685181.1 ABC transporter ATP-binding protein [Streptococcus suis]QOE27609.1 Lipid A export ATP-binding/permease protein MsbA [Streptococcus suis]